MKLSIVIVNYNVKYFLQQCLNSVFSALKNLQAEVWVVDNNSVDGSVEMVKQQFPQVKLIANKQNFGFSKANNQAIRQSKGEYILLLNPDTIVEETTFDKVVEFMDKTTDAGALGVKMIDGKGNFLPESKRGLPTPSVSFFKMSGLTRLFPHSKTFARYYLGHLDKNQNHKVQILSGAFMLIRKSVLDKIGLLDETFFMYGEDIDLSYRILKEGYNNYYFADTTIIHYKGESTKKGSLNYVYVFYNAMLIFIQKHFKNKNAGLFLFILRLSVILYAFLSATKRILLKIFLPIVDFISILATYLIVTPFWEHNIMNDKINYPHYIWLQFSIYAIIWQFSGFMSGIYDKPLKIKNIFSAIGIGTIVILIAYALIPLKFRFSRALIILGALLTTLILLFWRYIFSILKKYTKYEFAKNNHSRILIVANSNEAKRIESIIKQIYNKFEIIGYVSTDEQDNQKIGTLSQIEEIIQIHKPHEVIFSSKDITNENIISKMLIFSDFNINVKIAPKDSISIIGSNSINTLENLFVMDFNAINKPFNRRIKRLLDIALSINFLIFFFVYFWFVENKKKFLNNVIKVLFGKYFWVGLYSKNSNLSNKYEKQNQGVITPADVILKNKKLNDINVNNINLTYAKNYNIATDLILIFKSLKNLDN